MKPTIRKAEENEFLKVHRFVSRCKPLENYGEHFYKIMLRYCGDTCFVAEYDKTIVGFVMGFLSQVHDKTYFMWQIGVDPSLRGKDIGIMLLREAEKEIRTRGCERIELTVAAENTVSQRLFEKMGYTNISDNVGETVDVNRVMAVKDYYRPGGHFIVYEKNL